MKITTVENGTMIFEEVYVPMLLKTKDGESLVITMRDTGFEVMYAERMIELKKDQIKIHDLLISKNGDNEN